MFPLVLYQHLYKRIAVRACVRVCVCVCFLSFFLSFFLFLFLFYFLRIWAPLGAAMLVRSLPMKSKKLLACDVFDAFATQIAGLVYNVADTDCYQGTKWHHSRSCFLRLSNVDSQQTGPEMELNTDVSYFRFVFFSPFFVCFILPCFFVSFFFFFFFFFVNFSPLSFKSIPGDALFWFP